MVSYRRFAERCNGLQRLQCAEGINTDEEWNEIRAWLRPVLLNFVKSKRILLEGVTFKNSPSWCLHPLSCEDFTVNNIQVINPWYSQNGDALDLKSARMH